MANLTERNMKYRIYSGTFSRVQIFAESPVESPADIFGVFNFLARLTWDHAQSFVEPRAHTCPGTFTRGTGASTCVWRFVLQLWTKN